ncbi:hypothetical protein BH11PSE8_BH11PSE8_31760 [soil metagenome]
MPDIHIRREHQLGLTKAREVAWQWAEDAEKRLSMDCTVIEGDTSDTVEFTRAGVKGKLMVAADHFELDAKLGFLLAAFGKSIEAEIEKNLDSLLESSAAEADAAKPVKATAKKATTGKHARPGLASAPAKPAAKVAAKVATKVAAKTARK